MEFVIPGPEVATELLRAMLAVARAAEGGLSQTHRAVIDTAQRLALGSNVSVDELGDISPDARVERAAGERRLRRLQVKGTTHGHPSPGPAVVHGFTADVS